MIVEDEENNEVHPFPDEFVKDVKGGGIVSRTNTSALPKIVSHSWRLKIKAALLIISINNRGMC